MVGAGIPHHGLGRLTQSVTVSATWASARTGDTIARLNIVALSALVVVVIDIVISLKL